MAGKLPTGITSRVNDSGGKSRRQYRASLSDPSQRDVTGRRGKRVTSRWFDTLAEAKDWREAKLVQLRTLGSLAQDDRLTVGEACEQWIKLAEKAGVDGRAPVEFATADRYRSTLRNVIVPTIGAIRIAEMTAPRVVKWRDQLVLEHGHDAARRALALLKMVTRYQVTIGGLLVDAAASVRLSRSAGRPASDDDDEDPEDPVETFLEDADIAKILDMADWIASTGKLKRDHGRGMGAYQLKQRIEAWVWVRVLIYLLVATGMRMGEAAALRWSDIDWDAQTINIQRAVKRGGRVGKPKNRTSIRTLYMDAEFMEILRQLYVAKNDREPDHYIFGGDPRRPLHTGNFRRRQWRDLMEECGMVEDGENVWTPHDLRHYLASKFILAGDPDEQIAEWLGHANTIVTRTVYSHLFSSMKGAKNAIGARMQRKLLLGR